LSSKDNKKNKKSSDITNTQEIDLNSYYSTINRTTNNTTNSNNSNTNNNDSVNDTIKKVQPNINTNTNIKKKSSKKKKKKNRHPIRNFFRRLVNAVLIIFLIYSVVALFFISKVDKISFDNRVANSQGMLNSLAVKNILLIGTDGRTENDTGRSDTMVLLSINSLTRELTLTSFMRDMYVAIPNYGYDKLNASYSYGGASLLVDTIEENFSIRIDDCMIIDFTSFINMVDAVGGVDITVSDSEAQAINDILISEVNEIAGDDRMSDLLSNGGDFRLNGKQALSYSRIRYVGDADFERTQRQRYVINSIIDRLKTPNLFRIGNFASTTASEITTNMDTLGLYGLSLQVPFIIGYDITQQRIPADDTWYYDYANGQSVIMVDYSANTDFLSETIYKS